MRLVQGAVLGGVRCDALHGIEAHQPEEDAKYQPERQQHEDVAHNAAVRAQDRDLCVQAVDRLLARASVAPARWLMGAREAARTDLGAVVGNAGVAACRAAEAERVEDHGLARLEGVVHRGEVR